RLPVAIPERERKHPAKALHAVFAPGLPRVDDDLGIRPGPELMTERDQLRHQLAIVIHLAVVDDDDRAILVPERLLPRREVDDRQPALTEAHARLEMHVAFVG